MGQQLCQDAANSPAEAANLCLAPCQHTVKEASGHKAIPPGLQTLPGETLSARASEHFGYAGMLPLVPKVRLTTQHQSCSPCPRADLQGQVT